jgi:hypothetical protein
MFESFRKAPALLQRTLMNFLMLRELSRAPQELFANVCFVKS